MRYFLTLLKDQLGTNFLDSGSAMPWTVVDPQGQVPDIAALNLAAIP